MNFSQLIGQDNIINILKKDIDNKAISHAYIFRGPKGIGKYSLAMAFTSAINCKSQTYGCDSCSSCVKMESLNHPDVKVLRAEGSSMGIDTIRDEIQKDLSVVPYLGGKKIYIIDGADKMTPQAQNCLLKTLEEPPSSVIIILLCESMEQLLPTVISRCQRFEVKRVAPDLLEKFLLDKYRFQSDKIKVVSAFSQGIIGKAKDFIDNPQFIEYRQSVEKIIEGIFIKDSLSILSSMEILEEKKEDIDIIMDMITSWLRDINVYILTQDENRLINIDKKDRIRSFSRGLNSQKLVDIINIINEARNNMRYNSNYQLNIEVMLLKIQEVLE